MENPLARTPEEAGTATGSSAPQTPTVREVHACSMCLFFAAVSLSYQFTTDQSLPRLDTPWLVSPCLFILICL